MSDALLALGRLLALQGYRFTCATPATHRAVNARASNQLARTVADVFGWSRPFDAQVLSDEMFDLACAAGACTKIAGTRLWQPTLRFSSLEGLLFAHSAFPTDAADAVFFGPDTHRFIRALKNHAPAARRIVDVGCGSGAAGIFLASRGFTSLVLADVNEAALRLARVNASLAGVRAEIVQSDVLSDVPGPFDLVVANPPYLRDEAKRTYRDGGGTHGQQLGARMLRESLERLRSNPHGGTLLLYTGAPVVDGVDQFFEAVRIDLEARDVQHGYEVLDPDVFGDELAQPAYLDAERIAAVFLTVHVAGSLARSRTPATVPH